MFELSEATLFPDDFRTARPPRPLYCHQEFLDKLEARRNEPTGKRAALLMRRMAVDIARLHYKGANGRTAGGAGRGWAGDRDFISMRGGRRRERRRSRRAAGSARRRKRSSCATSGTTTIMRLSRRAMPTKIICR